MRLAASLLAVFALPVLAMSQELPTLKKGDKVVFLGDSITQGGGGPKGYVTLCKNAIVAKTEGVEIINAGISGNKVTDLQRRLQKDVLDRKPTIVVIYIGINDVWHGEKDPARGTTKDKFEAGLKEIIGKIQDGGAKVVLCTPTVIGEKKNGENSLDARLDEYSDISRKLAKDLKLPLCDLRKVFVDHLKGHNSENKERGVLTSDRVHLNEAGNKVVADAMLNILNK